LQFVHGDLPASQSAAAQATARFAGRDPTWEWKFRFLEANVRIQQGQSAEALDLLQSPLPASLSIPDFSVQRYALRAVALARLGNFHQAEIETQEARNLSAQNRSRFRAEACWATGMVDIELNNLREAAEILREGREAAHARSDSYLEARIRINEAVVANRQDRYDDALDSLNAAAALARGMDARWLLESVLGNTAWFYHQIGDHERARANFAEASEEAEKLGSQLDEVRWLNNLGVEMGALEDLDGAEASFRKALPLAESIHSARETISVEMGLVGVLYDRGNYAEAARICEAALPAAHADHNTATELDLVYVKGLLADKRGDEKEAQLDFRELDVHPQALPLHRLHAEDALAGLFDDGGQVRLAEIWYRKAVETFERQRATIRTEESRLPFFANAVAVYPDFAEFLIRHHREEEALQLLDTGRARALEEGLKLDKSGTNQISGPTSASPRALAAKLHAVLLEYSLGEKESWLWVATEKRVKFFRLPAKADIAKQVAAYRKAVLNAEDVLATDNAAGISLYETLVAPAQEMIPPQSRVFVLPDGALNELNFETLLVSKPTTHFWIDDVTVTNANSLRLLNSFANHGIRKTITNLLLIGDPTPPAGSFNDLPNAGREVSAVSGHFGSDHRTVLTGDHAFPGAYGDSHPEQFTYIHFVAHGTASRLEPLESAVVLSPNPGHPEEFRLYARDIIHTPLRAELVTISACYGSGSRAYAGEGLLGLSWAFLRAGVHSVIGALWAVSDLSTPQIMDRLYSEMELGHPPDQALHTAKLSMAHSQSTFRKPFYWAAFQVYAGS
jgi:CHAT domain-containing protein/predicted negative regulator of RcsB-dependent stress response